MLCEQGVATRAVVGLDRPVGVRLAMRFEVLVVDRPSV